MSKTPFEETSKKLKEQAEKIDKLPYFQPEKPKKEKPPMPPLMGPNGMIYSYYVYDSIVLLMCASYFVCIGLFLSSLLRG